jgi:hypothetical protein
MPGSSQKLKWVCLIGVSASPSKTDMRRLHRHVGFVPTAEVAVAAYSIAGATRKDGASLWKSCFAEAVDIDLRQPSAGRPFRNAKTGFEFEQTGCCLPSFRFAP